MNKNVAKFLALIIAILAKNGRLGGGSQGACPGGCCGGNCGGNQFGHQPSGGLAINFNIRGGLMG